MAKKRKISFNFLLFNLGEVELYVVEPLRKLLEYTDEKTNVEIKQNLSSDKFAFLSNYDWSQNEDGSQVITILFKNAKHSYRAPLLDKNTVEARENPKTMDEGEQNKTHLLIKIKDGSVLMFVETGAGHRHSRAVQRTSPSLLFSDAELVRR